MNKISILFLITFTLTSCSGGFGTMNRIMTSWEGAPLDQVISQWGYPQQEKIIAGRKIYIWDHTFTATLPSTTTGTGTVTGDMINITTITSGGGPSTWTCTRILEVNERNIVTRWQWSGNNCPFMDIGFGYENWERKKNN